MQAPAPATVPVEVLPSDTDEILAALDLDKAKAALKRVMGVA